MNYYKTFFNFVLKTTCFAPFFRFSGGYRYDITFYFNCLRYFLQSFIITNIIEIKRKISPLRMLMHR